MAEFIKEDGIGLNGEYNTKIAQIDSDPTLQLIHAHINAEYRNATSPDYWVTKTDDWLKNARNKFFHFSAHYTSVGMGPRFENGKRTRKQYDG